MSIPKRAIHEMKEVTMPKKKGKKKSMKTKMSAGGSKAILPNAKAK